MSVDVFLVEDDEAVRDSLKQGLEVAGWTVRAFQGMDEVLQALKRAEEPLVVVSDVRLVQGDGLQLQRAVRAHDAAIPVVLITGHGDIGMAVQAMRDGAHDFLEKPFSATKLATTVRRAVDQRKLMLENLALRRQIDQGHQWGLVGHSAAMGELRRLVSELGQSRVDVLLLGETGTGKEVVARAIHTASGSKDPFVAINCGALPESIFESEMFGHESGAFTGAARRRIGKIEHARNGTVFLDEIESTPPSLQAKLLRTLQERSIERLGSNEPIGVGCRFIAATKVDLHEAARRGAFREDLYFRLEVVTLRLPPLRSRADDIPLLFSHFVAQAAQRHGVEPPAWTQADMVQWQQRAWPGNVRELRNLAERWCLGLERLPAAARPSHASLNDRLAQIERTLIESALRDHDGNVLAAAEHLGIPRKTLYDKMYRHGIDSIAFRKSAKDVDPKGSASSDRPVAG
ncbi:MAG: sigma-54-dependent Fis family transcriptional regulator [Burkholderiaceae bacterium]|nr:sigma-54-dependent Fis family transcriptional regulator [Burkholderiaceae bacterium]